MFVWPSFPLFSLPEHRKASRQRVLLQPPAPRGYLGLPSPAPGLSSPVPVSSSFLVQRCLLRLRRREASEWRLPRSQNTTRSQDASRRARPLPFPSGGRSLASASSSPRRLGNLGSGTIVPGPEERADDRTQVPPETSTLGPARAEGGRVSKHPIPATGWTARRASGATGGGAEGQDLPSQSNLENPAAPGKGRPKRGEYPTIRKGKQGRSGAGAARDCPSRGSEWGLVSRSPALCLSPRLAEELAGQRRSLPGEEPLGSPRSRNARTWAELPGSRAGKGCEAREARGGAPGSRDR
ncbi:hypothetical protein J1605_015356 [Eschrichtius robustus]|uniref:Uncharacterized protein n=1 Tax=Eschrichtius robustus TaxID=9764 RepID=A0AB34GCE9_ESCRO|nr:hypothetical protein J1605_015356 [Eschrichtius robustus]